MVSLHSPVNQKAIRSCERISTIKTGETSPQYSHATLVQDAFNSGPEHLIQVVGKNVRSMTKLVKDVGIPGVRQGKSKRFWTSTLVKLDIRGNLLSHVLGLPPLTSQLLSQAFVSIWPAQSLLSIDEMPTMNDRSTFSMKKVDCNRGRRRLMFTLNHV